MALKSTFFSLIIPSYNRADFITDTLQSALNQTYRNLEIIVVDDGSTDNTEEVIDDIKDARIKYFKKKNEERAVARNYGIERATGDYITFLDSDDVLYPKHFEVALRLIEKQNHPEWFHLAYETKNENGQVLRQENKRRGSINKSLTTGNHLSCIGVFIRNDIAKENKFDEDRDIIGSEDYELWLRLAAKYPLHYSNEITSCMIQHEERSVTGFHSEKLVKRIKKLIEHVHKGEYIEKHDLNKFLSHRYLYLSLHLAMNKDFLLSLKYLGKAILLYPSSLFTHKSLGIVKNYVNQVFR